MARLCSEREFMRRVAIATFIVAMTSLGLMAASYFRHDRVRYYGAQVDAAVDNSLDGLTFELAWESPPRAQSPGFGGLGWDSGDAVAQPATSWGIDFQTDGWGPPRVAGSGRRSRLLVSHRALASLSILALCGVVLHARVQKRRRRQASLCQACGYDLRASPERCPECGKRAK
jgi:hypothetical protein